MYVTAKEYFKDKMYEFDKYMQLYNKYNNHHKVKKILFTPPVVRAGCGSTCLQL